MSNWTLGFGIQTTIPLPRMSDGPTAGTIVIDTNISWPNVPEIAMASDGPNLCISI